MRSRFTAVALLSVFCSYSFAQTLANEGLHSLAVDQENMLQFRQISLRILAAYKNQPRYIGSTDQWHLFLKKETSESDSRSFSSVFGYKIAAARADVINGWQLVLPAAPVNPENCPQITEFDTQYSRFSLPNGDLTRQACIGSNLQN